MELEERFFQFNEVQESSPEDENTIVYVDAEEETTAKQFFESNTGVPVLLEDILLSLCEKKLSIPLPAQFSVKSFHDEIMRDSPTDPLSSSIQIAASYASDKLDHFELLACILWCRISILFEDYISEKSEEVHMTNHDFTYATKKLHDLFLTQE